MNNGGLFQNGVSSNPNPVVAESNAPRSYGTLPHPHHHLQNIHVTEADTITQHWSRDNLLTSSYDVNLSTFPNNGPNGHVTSKVGGTHSRDNTLSRDVHHMTEYAMRPSCTAENLRSPSVA